MKKSKFSAKDVFLLIFLVVLLAAVAYYMFYLTPLKAEIASLEQEAADCDSATTANSGKMVEMNRMKAELEEVFALPEDQITEIAPYDNAKVIMTELNKILSQTQSYDVTFDTPSVSADGMVRRTVEMSFNTADYEDAQTIIRQLCNSKWRCLMTDFTIKGNEDITEDGISATASIVFFESKNLSK